MGTIQHHAIIVTGSGPNDPAHPLSREVNRNPLYIVHSFASELWGGEVTPITMSRINGFASFCVCPDGGKEGNLASNHGDKLRASFIESLRLHPTLQWVCVTYGELGCRIDSTSEKDGL